MAVRWTTRKGSVANSREITCVCGNTFSAYLSQIRKGGGKYCSVACRSGDSGYRERLAESIVGKLRDVSGSNNPRWKGGVTDYRNRFMSTRAYKDWRKAVYERDGYACVECGAAGNGKNLNADHIRAFSTHPDLRLDVDNGRTLCVDCHRATPNYGWRVWNERNA